MGIISDAKAIKDVQKIKKGGKAKLSVAQITGLTINLMDANNNLSKKDYKKVEELFQKLRQDDKKVEMDIEDYVSTVVDIIRKFDRIAPYEKYGGLEETEEFKAFMKDVRSNKKISAYNVSDTDEDDEEEIFTCDNCGAEVNEDTIECPKCGCSFIDDEDENDERIFTCTNCGTEVDEDAKRCPKCGGIFADAIDEEANNEEQKDSITWNEWLEKNFPNKGSTTNLSEKIKKDLNPVESAFRDIENLVAGSNGAINDVIAIRFLKILKDNPDLNKKAILYDFDAFAKELIKENPSYSLTAISYFLGVLNGNKIITENEMNKKLDEYQTMITDSMMSTAKDNEMDEVKKFAVNIQREFLTSIDETIRNEELRGIAGLIAFKTMMVYGARFYDGCEDKDKNNYNWIDDNSYLTIHFMYMIWFLVFREADDSITEYQNANSKKEYDKYLILFYETFTKYTDIIRHWHEIEKPKYIDFYNSFEKDMDELIEIGKYPTVFGFPKGREKLLNKLIEDNKNGIPIDPNFK